MSNTDGEGPQIFKCNACNYVGPRPDCFKVYCEKYDHTENSQLQQELASLREQLKIYQRNTEDQDSTIVYLNEQLKEANEIIGVLPKEEIRILNLTIKQQEEVIKELTSSLIYIVKTLGALRLPQDEPEALAYYEALKAIKKAKSLTTKDK